MRFRVRVFLLVFLLPSSLTTALAATETAEDALASERRQYDAALKAVNKGRWTEYEQLRPGLEDYPLAMYLDYYQLTRQSGGVRPADALRFISRSAGSPLPNRYTNAYLREAGRDGRWQDFLAVKADEPAGVELKCYYFRARLAAGDTAVAWEGAAGLWDAGESRPDACDPLFSAWIAAGQLTDDIVWARQLKAFEARQRNLMTYVAKQASPELAPWADKLLAVYQQPDKMRRQSLPPDSPYSADIASYGLALLARYSPATALQYWADYQRELEFTPQQARQVEYAIALYGLFAEDEDLAPWLDEEALARLQEDKLVELRLRWLLAEQDWSALAQTMPLLSDERRGHESWRYWQGVILEKQGDTRAANAIFDEVSRERSFHGFLASDKLGKAYSFNHQTPELDPVTAGDLRQLPVVRRVGELNFHESYSLAHSEWYYLLQEQDKGRNEQLAQLASQQGWYRMAIDAASRAQSWDALDLRFPTPTGRLSSAMPPSRKCRAPS